MAYTNDYMDYGVGDYETEEERKKRLAAEAAAAGGPGFGDIAGRYLSNRMGQAEQNLSNVGEMFTNPEAALQRRLGMQEAANTEVQTQTVKTYGDGSQEHITKTQVPAPIAPEPQMAAPAPVQQAAPQPQMAPPAAPPQAAPAGMSMAQQAHADEMAAQGQPAPQAAPAPAPAPQPQMAAPAPQPQMAAPTAPVAPQPMPQVAPTPQPSLAQAGAAAQGPINPAAPMPEIGQLPQPGPGIQVAGGAPGAGVAEAARAAQAAAEPAWVSAANAAGSDFNKLVDVAAKHPESRALVQEKLKAVVENQRKAEEADKIVRDAQNGDAKAMNKLEQALRPTRGKEREEVTVGDYLKAYMYARLGLNDLSQEVQAKISGRDTKFGQVALGGTNWSVETNAKTGEIIRAKDDEGNVATANTLNKLAAAGMKAGTHAFGFTGEGVTIPAGQPDAGQEYRQRTNAITGAVENVISTGPNAGTIYKGPPGLAKRVETNAAVKLNDAYIDFQTKPTIAMATQMLELAGKVDNGKNGAINNAMSEIQRRSPEIFNKIQPIAGAITATGGAAPSVAAPAPAAGGRVSTPGATATPGVGGGTSLLQQSEQQKANIEIGKELAVAGGKPVAEAKGKNIAKDVNNQNFADETYNLIKPIASLVKQSTGSGIGATVDSLAAKIGASTEGARAIAELEPLVYPILANVPRFEGAQSDYDVKTYQKAAGDFANPEKPIKTRLAALQGMISLLKKYDKEGKNDWSFSEEKQSTTGTTASGNKYKRVQ